MTVLAIPTTDSLPVINVRPGVGFTLRRTADNAVWQADALKKEAAYVSETLAAIYQTTRHQTKHLSEVTAQR
jgi:hypothetical protein